MSNFIEFADKIYEQINKLVTTGSEIFVTNISKADLKTEYLKAFNTTKLNPIYKTNTVHDCNCCISFLRQIGNVVGYMEDTKTFESIWDINIEGEYSIIASTMAKLVKEAKIVNIYRSDISKLGNKRSYKMVEQGDPIPFDHFNYTFDTASKYCSGHRKNTIVSSAKTNFKALYGSLTKLSLDAAKTTLKLIEGTELYINGEPYKLYRGESFKSIVSAFIKLKKEYDSLSSNEERNNFLWIESTKLQNNSKIKGTMIGMLMKDLSEGYEVTEAVRRYTGAIGNYKMPSGIVSKGQIEKLENKIKDAGLMNSLFRRYTTKQDIDFKNVQYIDNTPTANLSIFQELKKDIPEKINNLKNISDITIKELFEKLTNNDTTLELLIEPRHKSNFMSLTSPMYPEAPNLFQWDNNIGWTYNGERTDSIKELVKKAGGKVNAVMRTSLAWFNNDDLDIHVIEPNGNKIFYVRKENSQTSGELDIDMHMSPPFSKQPVENIIWTNKKKMLPGRYKVIVHNYAKRQSINFGFIVEFEYDNVIRKYTYDIPLQDKQFIDVVEFDYDPNTGIDIIKSIDSEEKQISIYNLNTKTFHKVNLIMKSPNYWEDNNIGNEHIFFILNNCIREGGMRSIFNEFLKPELNEYRKAFEAVAQKVQIQPSNNQLSGLGFSLTQSNSVICKITQKNKFRLFNLKL